MKPDFDFDASLVANLPKLMGYAFNRLRDQMAVEDVVQQTCLQALSHRDQFQPGTNFSAWLIMILHNIIVSNFRRGGRFVPVENGFMENLLITDPEAPIIYDAKKARAEIKKLAPKNRAVAEIILEEGYSYEEAAERLGVTVGVLKSRLHQIRKRLRRILLHSDPNLSTKPS